MEHFAYPNGDYNDDAVTVLRAQGFKTAVTDESGVWEAGKDAYLIPRYAVGRYEPMGYFKAKLSGMFL